MEGNTLMDELRKVVFWQLRTGVSITEVISNFQRIEQELMTMKDYAKAIEESNRAP
jgi:hypothetical protein